MTHEGSVPRKPHVGISKAEAANKQGLHLSQEAACQQGKNSWSLVLYTKSSRSSTCLTCLLFWIPDNLKVF